MSGHPDSLNLLLHKVQLLHALENGLFMQSGKFDSPVKWLSSIPIFGMVLLPHRHCHRLGDQDKFAIFVGFFAWYVCASHFLLFRLYSADEYVCVVA